MTVITITEILAAVCGALALAGGLYLYRSMFMATRGQAIPPYPEPRAALVVLDLQEGYRGTGAGRPPPIAPQPHGLFATVNRLITWAAAGEMEVAYLRQVFASDLIVRLHGGRRQGRVIVDRRVTVINDHDFEKNRTDAFASRPFEQFLIDRQVNHLYLVGVDAAYCVYYTALGARQRGYRVTVVSDAVRSRRPLNKVLARFRRNGIEVVTSAELLGE